MKKYFTLGLAVAVWSVIGLVVVPSVVSGCSAEEEILTSANEDGMLLGDDLVAIKGEDGRVTIKNTVTGAITIQDIKIDWTSSSSHDSLAVFCSDDKRGFYNMYTGEIAIPAQYRRAWLFSEGLAGVQRNGMIGFIDRKGNTVIPFRYPYHGNPLSSFQFQDGHCVVADTTGKCGIINKVGDWIVQPEYDNINAYKEYAIVSKAGVRMQVDYDGTVLNSFVLDYLERLTYEVKERCENKEGNVSYITKEVDTGMFVYRVGGRCGLMDAECHRITEPLYRDIMAVDMSMFRATLIDYYSEVILNAKGEVMK